MPADSAVHVPLGSDANGLFWNAATDTLLVADDDRHVRVWKEDDGHPGGVVSDFVELPATRTSRRARRERRAPSPGSISTARRPTWSPR
jgi:hypothetical protein